jgi:hypothetical protein
MERAAFAALAVERFEANRNVLDRYFSFDLMRSVEARRKWIAPTLASFDQG